MHAHLDRGCLGVAPRVGQGLAEAQPSGTSCVVDPASPAAWSTPTGSTGPSLSLPGPWQTSLISHWSPGQLEFTAHPPGSWQPLPASPRPVGRTSQDRPLGPCV